MNRLSIFIILELFNEVKNDTLIVLPLICKRFSQIVFDRSYRRFWRDKIFKEFKFKYKFSELSQPLKVYNIENISNQFDRAPQYMITYMTIFTDKELKNENYSSIDKRNCRPKTLTIKFFHNLLFLPQRRLEIDFFTTVRHMQSAPWCDNIIDYVKPLIAFTKDNNFESKPNLAATTYFWFKVRGSDHIADYLLKYAKFIGFDTDHDDYKKVMNGLSAVYRKPELRHLL